MDLVAILDTETSDLDPKVGQVVELAVVCYSIRLRCMVSAFCEPVLLENYRTNTAVAINHIPDGVCALGRPAEEVWAYAGTFIQDCEYLVAHNAEFDRQWVPKNHPEVYDRPWIDTCGGVTWPLQTREGSSLISLALEHGLGVVDPHRALQDCLLLARLMTRCAELGHDVSAILERGLRPMATFKADVPYERRELAKNAGFHWQGDAKMWTRRMAVEDAQNLPFRTVKVGP